MYICPGVFDAASNILFRGTRLARFTPTRLVPRATLKCQRRFLEQPGLKRRTGRVLLCLVDPILCPTRRPEVAGSGCLRREYPNARWPEFILEMELRSVKMRGAVLITPKTLNRKLSANNTKKSNGARLISRRQAASPGQDTTRYPRCLLPKAKKHHVRNIF